MDVHWVMNRFERHEGSVFLRVWSLIYIIAYSSYLEAVSAPNAFLAKPYPLHIFAGCNRIYGALRTLSLSAAGFAEPLLCHTQSRCKQIMVKIFVLPLRLDSHYLSGRIVEPYPVC